VVIPQGSRLIGRYSADVAYGQSRVLAAWDELILPNGSRISLRGMSAADGQGQSGMEDQVNNHFLENLVIGAVGVVSWVLQRNSRNHKTKGAFNTPSGLSSSLCCRHDFLE
jgi:type IV secretory pathway VirB10-like protein